MGVEYMTRVTHTGAELSDEERQLLSAACKNRLGLLRAAWRDVGAYETQQKFNEEALALIRGYRTDLEEKIRDQCREVLSMLLELVETDENEAKVFYLKMVGDYNRYLCEVDGEGSDAANNANEAYQNALITAKCLPASHPSRLGLSLNLSVLTYEVLRKPEEAVKVIQAAIEASDKMQGITDEQVRDS